MHKVYTYYIVHLYDVFAYALRRDVSCRMLCLSLVWLVHHFYFLFSLFPGLAICKEIAGTPANMAPEVWTGKAGAKCDMWSMGATKFSINT